MDEVTEDLQWHEEFGLHSGIPACCVAFYVRVLARGGADLMIGINRRRRRQHGHRGMMHETNYVPCTACLHGIIHGTVRPIEVHQCSAAGGVGCLPYERFWQ